MKKSLAVVLMMLACFAAYAETDYTVERKVDYLWRHVIGSGGSGGDYPTKEWVDDKLGEEAQARAGGDSALSNRVTEVEGSIPTNVSELTNDVGYITSGDVPTAVSAFSNDVGYITASDVPAQVQSDWSETNSASPAYIDNKPALITSNEVSELARNVAKEVVDEMASVGWGSGGAWYKLVVQAVPYPLTVFTFGDESREEVDISGTLDIQWMVDRGWRSDDSGWLVEITSVNIGANVTSLDLSAFGNCAALTNVTMPSSVTSIGPNVFAGCANLTSVVIPDSVTNILASAFGGSGLTDVVIPDSVVDVGNYAFAGCAGLTNVTIGSGVKSIEGNAFYNCAALTNVTIPDSVTNIGSHAFYGCDSLTNVTMSGKITAQVSGMAHYPWYLPSGCVITCTDDSITIP